jgi:hypothetical protein
LNTWIGYRLRRLVDERRFELLDFFLIVPVDFLRIDPPRLLDFFLIASTSF